MSAPPENPFPSLGPVDHIGVAVLDLDEGKRLYGEVFGLRLVFEEEVPTEQVRVAGFDGGGLTIELLQATDPNSPIAKFVAKRGPGIHHVAYKVDDVGAMLKHLQAQGIRTLDDEPRPGAGGCQVAFIHPKSAGGVLVEISDGGAHS